MAKKDYCQDDGARTLAERTAQYWTDKGLPAPDVKLIGATFHPAMRSARDDLRSDMVNGWPLQVFLEKNGLTLEQYLATRPKTCESSPSRSKRRRRSLGDGQ